MIPLEKFTLANNLTVYGTTILSNSSFVPQVRDYHVNRLPQYQATYRGAICPYCGKVKDRRSMRLDHIVPVRIWCRWHMHFAGEKLSGRVVRSRRTNRSGPFGRYDEIESVWEDERQRTKAFKEKFDEAYGDDDNLILCCSKCNGHKSDQLPDIPNEDRIHTGNVGEAKFRNYYQRARVYFAGQSAISIFERNYAQFREIRENPNRDLFLITRPANRYGTKTRSDEEIIEGIIVIQLATSRPDIHLASKVPALMAKQAAPQRTEQLRLCLYCLGLYKKQAFSLDHIHPVLRSRTADPFSVEGYNDPSNLVAVCGSCNSAKGSRPLTRLFIATRVQQRISGDDEPGIETRGATIPERQNIIEEAYQQLDRIFGRAMSGSW